jgi:hypothetical protein
MPGGAFQARREVDAALAAKILAGRPEVGRRPLSGGEGLEHLALELGARPFAVGEALENAAQGLQVFARHAGLVGP